MSDAPVDGPVIILTLEPTKRLLHSAGLRRCLDGVLATEDAAQESATTVLELETETRRVHKYLQQRYHAVYAPLAEMVQDPNTYVKLFKGLGRDFSKHGMLASGVERHVVQVISYSIPSGDDLARGLIPSALKERWADIEDGIAVFDAVRDSSARVLEKLVENLHAPNLTALLGADVAALLIALAGGLRKLSTLRAIEIRTVGKQQVDLLAGQSTRALLHGGVMERVAWLQTLDHSIRRNVLVLLGNKAALCARVDTFSTTTKGEEGETYKGELLAKCASMRSLGPEIAEKAVARPEGKIPLGTSKRGGWKAKLRRTKYSMTEEERKTNKMAMGRGEGGGG